MNEAIVVALLASLGSFIVVVISAMTGARKSQFDSLCVTVSTLQETVVGLQEENSRLRGRVDELERENTELRAQLDRVQRARRL